MRTEPNRAASTAWLWRGISIISLATGLIGRKRSMQWFKWLGLFGGEWLVQSAGSRVGNKQAGLPDFIS